MLCMMFLKCSFDQMKELFICFHSYKPLMSLQDFISQICSKAFHHIHTLSYLQNELFYCDFVNQFHVEIVLNTDHISIAQLFLNDNLGNAFSKTI